MEQSCSFLCIAMQFMANNNKSNIVLPHGFAQHCVSSSKEQQ